MREESKNTTKGGHHWPASETPFEWGFAGGPMIARTTLKGGLVAL